MIEEPRSSSPGLLPATAPLDLAPLEARLSERALVADADVIAAQSVDHALFSPVGRARALVRARSVEDVQACLRFAHEHRVPVIPQGARTGLSGGANAIDGALLLSVAGLDRILEVDTVERTCTVQAGVINQDLKDHLVQFGLSYPPDPGSVAISSVGGNAATNAGGLCCVKYGVTGDYVRRLTVVLADGRITTVGRPTAKGVAGFDLSRVFIGSEGTLGVIVDITFDLVPSLPDPLTAVALFPDVVSASGAVTDFMRTGARPSLMEFIDGPMIGMLNDYGDFGLPADAGGMLIVQSDGDGSLEAAAAELAQFTQVARECGADEVMHSEDPRDSALLIAARRAVAPASGKYAAAHGGGVLVDDICVPIARMRDLFTALVDITADHPGVTIANCGHAGDGNFHPNVFFDAADPQSVALAETVFGRIMEVALELGGTITGEHGVGVLKREWLARELGPVAQDMHLRIKEALDPRGILSPGKMLSALS